MGDEITISTWDLLVFYLNKGDMDAYDKLFAEVIDEVAAKIKEIKND